MQMSQVLVINRVFLYKLHHPPRYSGNFADYSRQFHDDDRDTWSQSQNEEGPLVYPFEVTSAGFWHNLQIKRNVRTKLRKYSSTTRVVYGTEVVLQ